jgi:hypothetical protein
MTSRLTKSDREAMQVLLEKHQKKHPGCSLGERRCSKELADDCVGKGDKSLFVNGGSRCNKCIVIIQREYYDKVTIAKRAAARLKKKATKSVKFEKGTKKE